MMNALLVLLLVGILLSPRRAACLSPSPSSSLSLSSTNNKLSATNIEEIERGGVVVIPNWLPNDLITRMRNDAKQLFADGLFRPDGLTNTALGKPERQGFSAKADRQTFRGGDGWGDKSAGDYETREEFATLMANLRRELAVALDRQTLAPDGIRKHEMTYNWYEPGASLGRHLDEHHEETKGAKGWQLPTRRSVTWLVYLNENWREEEGGALHTFPRQSVATAPVGAHNGNLQIGWIDRNRPVFLDAWRPSGQTALYMLSGAENNNKQLKREYVSVRDFDVPQQPVEFDKFLMPPYRKSFEQISTSRLDPRFVKANGAQQRSVASSNENESKYSLDVLPAAGTLVLFDSVSLPHLVKEVTGKRRRIAATGWFHEDSQGEELRQDMALG